MKFEAVFHGRRRPFVSWREKTAPAKNAAFNPVFTAVYNIRLLRELPFSMVGNLLPFFWVDHRGRRSFPSFANDFDE